jgi:hypothetical protein
MKVKLVPIAPIRVVDPQTGRHLTITGFHRFVPFQNSLHDGWEPSHMDQMRCSDGRLVSGVPENEADFDLLDPLTNTRSRVKRLD